MSIAISHKVNLNFNKSSKMHRNSIINVVYKDSGVIKRRVIKKSL